LNGAGKTTLLKIVSHYLRPDTGQVLIAGRATKDYGVRELARELAHVPQDFPTEFPFTVAEFVRMGRYAWQNSFFTADMDFEKTHAVLSRLDLVDFENRLIGTLSGGERQRVLLARALVQDTPILLLDEPLNHLDVKQRAFFLKILKEENEIRGRTIVAVMHDLEEVQRHFTHVLFLKDGQLSHFGTIAQAFTTERLNQVFDMDFSQ
jgi:iron complex transport system ATP-binding protein